MLKWVAWRVILDYLKFDERKESDDSDLPYQWPYARVAATWASSNYDRMIEMFLPFNMKAILLGSLATVLVITSTTNAQQAEYNRRVAAMQEARLRAQSKPKPNVRPAAMQSDIEISVDLNAPKMSRAATQSRASVPSATPARQAQRAVYTDQRRPQRTGLMQTSASQSLSRTRSNPIRVAQKMESAVVDGGAPVVSTEVLDDGYYDGEIIEGEFIEGGCESCGEVGGYFDSCDSCCGRGGCPPGSCWITGLGELLKNAEYFSGATAFRSPMFRIPGSTFENQMFDDSSYGLYAGFNAGLPLCRLSCGLFSGQFGVRSVQSNFNGNRFTAEERNQTFITGGFYRRVDYGMQMGLVVDVLHDDWFTTDDVVQLRGDLGWVYPNGTTLGFRFAKGVQDADTSGEYDNVAFTDLIQQPIDHYRFYYKYDAPSGGTGAGYIGWSGDSQTVLGLDFDIPVAERVAVQAGFSYYLGEEGMPPGSLNVGGNPNDAFNIFVGMSFRPRGMCHYNSYHRPMFSVADNGSLMIRRDIN